MIGRDIMHNYPDLHDSLSRYLESPEYICARHCVKC